ncbi:MAG: S9 family peptidase, partial [Cytophagaceae bacterium]|nr:S9 family peptidase [Cytophagaceae bacterium]
MKLSFRVAFLLGTFFSVQATFLKAQPNALPQSFPFGQPLTILDAQHLRWTPDGNAFYQISAGEIVQTDARSSAKTTLVTKAQLTPAGADNPLVVQAFDYFPESRTTLIYTEARKVWRYATRGDYWVLNGTTGTLTQLGKGLPESSLMFAKLSPDGDKAAYVSARNLYVEDLKTGQRRALTTDGTDRLINGTFDWVYEEELDCRDGFRWSPDSKRIAFWQVDARKVKNYLMLNQTDSTYSYIIPVEYPKAGEPFSPCVVKTVDVTTGQITPLSIPGDPQLNLLPRMDWIPGSGDLLVQQLDRKQQTSNLFVVNGATGLARKIQTETDPAWVDVRGVWPNSDMINWYWLAGSKDFLMLSEKGGWRQLYRISREGQETLLSKEPFDIIKMYGVDEKSGFAYFAASPQNATQQYLYRLRLDGKGQAERLTPAPFAGTNDYEISPNGTLAKHEFSAANTFPAEGFVTLPAHQPANGKPAEALKPSTAKSKTEFFQVKTSEGVTMDGWLVKPTDFDSTRKYPVVFYVYGEPAGATVIDRFGVANNFLFSGNLADKGYIYVSLDNRGTPAPKGREWRKAIYRNNGIINTRDQALATQELLKTRPYLDASRVAIWGWSGGGMSTLNALMQYPDVYQTGLAIAAISNLLLYDNIYEERYMGRPAESRADYLKGSPISHVKNLTGNLLYIHGTGDDNVHYQNAEVLINELIKNGKLFSLMIYPNRTHS